MGLTPAKLIEKPLKRLIPVITPPGFTWTDHPLVGKIFTDGEGNFQVIGFDVADYQVTGKTYYVSTTGSDSNDGLTLATALRNIKTAYDKADVKVILVDGGTYERNGGGFSGAVWTIDKDISIKALPGEQPIFITHDTLEWSLVEGKTKTYQATRSAVIRVFDTTILDAYGDYTELNYVVSVDDVESTPNSWYIDGTTVYAHTIDNRAVDNTIRAYLNVLGFNVAGTSTITVYLEGLDFEGGKIATCKINNANASVYIKKCSAKYNGGPNSLESYVNGFYLLSAKVAYLQNCVAAKCMDDGISFDFATKGIEINSISRNNGFTDTDNGTTSHAGSKIIRINGAYINSTGPVVGDVNANTQTWNMGCIASGATTGVGYVVQDGDATGWYDHCKSYDNATPFKVSVGCTGHMRGCSYDGTLSNAGTQDNY